MLMALLDALIDFVRVLVGWLVDVAVVLEATPFSFAWPLVLALLLQLLLAAVSGVVWWARGAVWPINCGYPETTTGRGPCHNDVFGEWNRCRIHRRRGWLRRTDAHVISDLRRWQSINRDGRVVEREDAGGSGFLRQYSERIGLLYYRGWARPPTDVRRLLPVVIEDYRYRFAQLRASWRPPPRGLRRSRATSVALDDVILAAQLIAGLLLVGLAFIGAAGVMKSRAPQRETTRAVLEYAAVFFLYLAVVTFKNGIIGRRQGNGRVLPVPDWIQRSWVEAGSAFGVVVSFALATVFVAVVVYPVALVATAVYVWSRLRKWTP
jgi:hypothetical protein